MGSRNLLLTLFLLLITVIGGTMWFFATHDRVEKKVWIGLQGEAKNDEYYIAAQFLRQRGLDVVRERNYDKLGYPTMPTDVDTILMSNPASKLTPYQTTQLIDWVKAGNKLVIEGITPNYAYQDSHRPNINELTKVARHQNHLLTEIGIAVVTCDYDNCVKCAVPKPSGTPKKTKAEKNTEPAFQLTDEELAEALLATRESEVSNKFWAGSGYLHLVDRSLNQFRTIKSDVRQTAFLPGRCGGDIYAVYQLGKGIVVIYNQPSSIFSSNPRWGMNDSIFSHRNATYLNYLLNLGTPSHRVLWYETETHQNIWQTLYKFWKYAIFTAIVLLIFWLWYHFFRFGPYQVEHRPYNLSLDKHIGAVGYFTYHHVGREAMIASCYTGLERSIQIHIPFAPRLSNEYLADKIAQQTGMEAGDVYEVLLREDVSSDNDFVRRVRLINEIRKKL